MLPQLCPHKWKHACTHTNMKMEKDKRRRGKTYWVATMYTLCRNTEIVLTWPLLAKNSFPSTLSSLAIISFTMYLLLYIKSSTNINSPFYSLPSEAIGFHKSWKSKKLWIQICTVYYHKSIINPDITAKHCSSSYCKALSKESKRSLKSQLWKGDPKQGGKPFFFFYMILHFQ